jgi:hypothetical protein
MLPPVISQASIGEIESSRPGIVRVRTCGCCVTKGLHAAADSRTHLDERSCNGKLLFGYGACRSGIARRRSGLGALVSVRGRSQ